MRVVLIQVMDLFLVVERALVDMIIAYAIHVAITAMLAKWMIANIVHLIVILLPFLAARSNFVVAQLLLIALAI